DGTAVRVQAWVDLDEPALDLDPAALGRLVAGLHRVDFAGTIGLDAWYSAAVGEPAWTSLARDLAARRAPFADELAALVPELVALETCLGGPLRDLRTCHRDLWADNVRRTASGELCVFDFDNAGLADPSQELAAVLVEHAGADSARARAIRSAYEAAGGPGRVRRPTDFGMAVAQLCHILETGCRRWLRATTDADRAENEAWVREFLDRPIDRNLIESLLSG
ncbi:MAG TPA: aminoglycoside phosphotransferase family protein, partial [Candidatus Limnocylindrales bacterium]|nr:aminoglycoside phosphotransferase family protein [Candidatus Limnocylindrales bacterium]